LVLMMRGDFRDEINLKSLIQKVPYEAVAEREGILITKHGVIYTCMNIKLSKYANRIKKK